MREKQRRERASSLEAMEATPHIHAAMNKRREGARECWFAGTGLREVEAKQQAERRRRIFF